MHTAVSRFVHSGPSNGSLTFLENQNMVEIGEGGVFQDSITLLPQVRPQGRRVESDLTGSTTHPHASSPTLKKTR